jgi:hypothetical protein
MLPSHHWPAARPTRRVDGLEQLVLSNVTVTPLAASACGKRVAHTNRDAFEKNIELDPRRGEGALRTYRYDDRILEALAGHGLVPLPSTPPGVLRDAVRDLYRYEIRRLRDSLLAGRIAKRDYASHVIDLRGKYPLLSVPLELWTPPDSEGPATPLRPLP